MATLDFHCISYDTLHIPAGKLEGSYTLFNDANENNFESVANESESQIVSRLMTHYLARGLFNTQLGLGKESYYRQDVKDPIVTNPNSQGDIDLIIWESATPHHAIAMQCKRVKVKAVDVANDKVNKLQEVEFAVEQANKMYEIFKFNRTYLVLLIVVDGRARNEYNMMSRGATDTTFKQCYDLDALMRLKNDIGIVVVEIIQPSSSSFAKAGMFCIGLGREAKWGAQAIRITNCISSFEK